MESTEKAAPGMHRRTWVLTALALFVGFVLGLAGGLVRQQSNSSDRVLVGRAASPDGSREALLYRNSDGDCLLGIRSVPGSLFILQEPISIPKGYHQPKLLITWGSNSEVDVMIDHDFGDYPIKYTFDSTRLTLRRVK